MGRGPADTTDVPAPMPWQVRVRLPYPECARVRIHQRDAQAGAAAKGQHTEAGTHRDRAGGIVDDPFQQPRWEVLAGAVCDSPSARCDRSPRVSRQRRLATPRCAKVFFRDAWAG